MTTSRATESAALPRDPLAFLGEVFSSRIRAHVLTFLTVRNDAAYSLTEIARGLGLSISSVQHECYKLERLDVLVARTARGSRRYRLNVNFPTTRNLEQLILGVFPLRDLLVRALADFEKDGTLSTAAIAREAEGDAFHLLLVGDLTLMQLASIQERIAHLLGVDPDVLHMAFFPERQWLTQRDERDERIERLLTLELTPLIGSLEFATTAP